MSSERQGQVGDLGCKSKEELTEILKRQENILSNKRFLQSLPDKGKKLFHFAERVRLAIADQREEETRQTALSCARSELQSKYQQAFASRQPAVQDAAGTSHQNRQVPAGDMVQEEEETLPVCDMVQEEETSPVSAHVQENNKQQGQFVSRAAVGETMETLNSDDTKESDLAEALERVRLSETATTGSRREDKNPSNSIATDNFFLGKQTPKKPNYIDVLERTETISYSANRKPQFHPNQLSTRSKGSPSGSPSPSPSPGSASPLSALARKERDRKHLDDITSARLPLFRYSPAKLLSLEESGALLREQTKKQQELYAKLAAQKLSEGLTISMGTYTPDGGPMAAYREVHDDGAQLSSEED